jgi:hypothetical protein
MLWYDIFDPPTRTPLDAPSEISHNFSFFLQIFLRNFHVFVRLRLSLGSFVFVQGIFFLVFFLFINPPKSEKMN